MKKIIFMAALSVALTSHAQIGGLIKKAKDKATKSEEPAGTTKTEEKTVTETKGNNSAPADGLDLDFTTFNLTPAITMNSLLYGTVVYPGGSSRFENYTASFIPYKKKDGTNVDAIRDQSKFLKVKVYKGTEFVDYFEYDGSQTFDDLKLRKFNAPSSQYKKNGEWANGTNVDFKKWGEGTYRLEFFAGSKLFYNFEFEVYKLTNSDPYAKLNEMYLSRGPWNKYAYMEQEKSGNMIFGFYLQHEQFQPNAADPNKTLLDVSWTINITKDGKPFATQYDPKKPRKDKVERAAWKAVSTALTLAGGTKQVQLADFTDGTYKMEVKVDMEKNPRLYAFKVANGKIVLMDEQDRSKNTNPNQLIEGWNNFYWFKMQ